MGSDPWLVASVYFDGNGRKPILDKVQFLN